MYRHLETMAIGDSLVEPEESIPRLIGIADECSALASKSPMKSICQGVAQYRRISNREPLAVIQDSLLWGSTREKRRLRIAEILKGAAPEQNLLSVGGKVVVHAGDDRVVVQTDWRGKAVSGVVHSVTYGR